MKQTKLAALVLVLSLAGCHGPGEVFEPRTAGVRHSEWYVVNANKRYTTKPSHLQRQVLAEQHRQNNLVRAQEQRAIVAAQRQSLVAYQSEQTQQQPAQEQRDIAAATRRSMQTYNTHTSQGQDANSWQPNKGNLVVAGEIILNLQRELGRKPSLQEMRHQLQTQMALSRQQSSIIIAELGLY